ncbi:MAG TPA: putative O-glycosylation ligase, exosortase A system-associated [Gammaproteobacteria bacterium]|nr:putative O-glycosylation ligase, exosortase A system-associated [Gammaproteobacteria bacterium]
MRDVIITLVVFGLLPMVLMRPSIGVYLWSWLGYMNPHRLSWGFAYSFPFVQVVAIVTLASMIFSKEPKKLPNSPLVVLWALFVLWMCIATAVAIDPGHSVTELSRTLKIQVMILVTFLLINDREKLHTLAWVLALSIGFFGIKGGFFTIATGGNFRVWGPPGSFIEGNNELALALIIVMPLFRYLQLTSSNKWVRRGLVLAMLLCAASIVASYSRGAFLAGGVMAFMFWLKSRHKFAIGVVGVMIVGAILMFLPQQWFDRMSTIENFEEDRSAMGRINAWTFAFNLAKDRPLTGGGFDTFTPELFIKYAPDPTAFHDAHSIYFEILAEQGFVGLGLFLMMWFATYKVAGNIVRQCKGRDDVTWARDLAAMLQVSMAGYAVGGAFLGLAYFDLPYHIMAMVAVLHHLMKEKGVMEPQTSSLRGRA